MPKTLEGFFDEERRVEVRACGKCVPKICKQVEDQANRDKKSFSREHGFSDLTAFEAGELYDFFVSYTTWGRRRETSHFQTDVTIWGTGLSVRLVRELIEKSRRSVALQLERIQREERQYTYRAGDDGPVMRLRVE